MASKTVIFIDDDPSTKHFAMRTSNCLDCDFQFFERACDVFDKIEAINPKLMVIDLSMTNLDDEFDEKAGTQVTADIRKRFGDRFPILILTGNETPSVITECLRSGADDYYVKSHDFTGLLKRVAAWLVVDYKSQNAKTDRNIAADALQRLVSEKGLLSVKEWRQVALLEVCKKEPKAQTKIGKALANLFVGKTATAQ